MKTFLECVKIVCKVHSRRLIEILPLKSPKLPGIESFVKSTIAETVSSEYLKLCQ